MIVSRSREVRLPALFFLLTQNPKIHIVPTIQLYFTKEILTMATNSNSIFVVKADYDPGNNRIEKLHVLLPGANVNDPPTLLRHQEIISRLNNGEIFLAKRKMPKSRSEARESQFDKPTRRFFENLNEKNLVQIVTYNHHSTGHPLLIATEDIIAQRDNLDSVEFFCDF